MGRSLLVKGGKCRDLRRRQEIELADLMPGAGFDEPPPDLFAQPGNVHRAAAHKVVQALQPLGRALGIRAIRDRLAVGASDWRAADRAHFREGPRSLLAGAQLY